MDFSLRSRGHPGVSINNPQTTPTVVVPWPKGWTRQSRVSVNPIYIQCPPCTRDRRNSGTQASHLLQTNDSVVAAVGHSTSIVTRGSSNFFFPTTLTDTCGDHAVG